MENLSLICMSDSNLENVLTNYNSFNVSLGNFKIISDDGYVRYYVNNTEFESIDVSTAIKIKNVSFLSAGNCFLLFEPNDKHNFNKIVFGGMTDSFEIDSFSDQIQNLFQNYLSNKIFQNLFDVNNINTSYKLLDFCRSFNNKLNIIISDFKGYFCFE